MKKILEQIKKIRWPSKKELTETSLQTVICIAFFATVFLGFQLIISILWRAL